MNLTITLTIEEVNYILAALGSRPFAEVNALIAKIKADGDAQVAASVTSPAPSVEETPIPDAPSA